MLNRTLTYLIVALIVVVALAAWVEWADQPAPEQQRTGNPESLRAMKEQFEKNREKGKAAAQAYRIDREGRKSADSARSSKDHATAEQKWTEAEQKYQQALAMFRDLKHMNGEAEVLNDLGIFYSDRRQYAQALECYERSLELKKTAKWAWGEGNTWVNLGSLHSREGRFFQALQCYKQAVNAYERAGDKKAAADIRRLIGR